jgi:hypothetical protein
MRAIPAHHLSQQRNDPYRAQTAALRAGDPRHRNHPATTL